MASNPVFPRLYASQGQPGDLSRVQDNINSVVQPAVQALAATPIMGAPPPVWVKATLLNRWIPAGTTGDMPLSFHRDALGYVHLQGIIDNGSGGALGSTSPICRLPLGYRPANRNIFAVWGNTAGVVDAVSIALDGYVRSINNVPNTNSLSLALTFLAES